MKVYGPYLRKDGRKHVILYEHGKRTTVSYPKFLMEQHLGRKLEDWETVDHTDRDFTNNALGNLQILSRPEHSSIDNIRVKLIEIVCVWCGAKELKRSSVLTGNARQGKAGPFCSKKCSGLYGAAVQNGRCPKLGVQDEIPLEDREYYRPTK